MKLLTLSVLIMLLLLTAPALPAQDIGSFVKENTVAIKTISPDSSGYTDLAAFGNAIGDARIVFLGEQDHGDAPAFLAKTRLIRYLHEKMGFNVLAFESDFFGLNAGWDQADKSALLPFFQGNIFQLWSYCDACQYLFKTYIPQTQTTATPIQVTGFDNQTVLRYSGNWLSRSVDSILRAHDLPITHDAAYSTRIIPFIDSLKRYYLKDASGYAPQRNYLLRIKEELAKVLPATDFWMMVVDNLIASNKQYEPNKVTRDGIGIRDEQMAKNLLWLATIKYPNEKIIVWAQNGHISKYGHYNDSWQDQHPYMGTVFDAIKDPAMKTYVLGFSSATGRAGRLGEPAFEVKAPKKKAFETWIPDSLAYAFTDFTVFRNANPAADVTFHMKVFGHAYLYNKSEWHKIFDGIFFIREMYPCNLDKR